VQAMTGAPVFVTLPFNGTSEAGSTAVLSVLVGGTEPFTYQWQLNGTNILGGTNATLTLTNVQYLQSGNYTVVVSNELGQATSPPPDSPFWARQACCHRPPVKPRCSART